jgi:hypothetical protein
VKKLIISLLVIAVISYLTLTATSMFGFTTKYHFGFYNLKGGIMCFPVLVPIGIQSIITIIMLVCVCMFYIGYFFSAFDAPNKKWSVSIAVTRLALLLWCIALCDYCYWDIADSAVSPNMDYTFMYQQYQHATMSSGDFAWLGYTLCLLNIGAFIFHLWLVPSGIPETEPQNETSLEPSN